MESVALVQFPADHRQVDGPLDDLVVVSGLEQVHREQIIVAEIVFILTSWFVMTVKWNILHISQQVSVIINITYCQDFVLFLPCRVFTEVNRVSPHSIITNLST